LRLKKEPISNMWSLFEGGYFIKVNMFCLLFYMQMYVKLNTYKGN